MLAIVALLAALAAGDVIGPQDLLESTGYTASDWNNDGFLDSTVGGQFCNPMGYVELHPISWRLNRRWALDAVWPSSLLTAVPPIEDESNYGSSGSWLDSWPEFGIEEGAQSGLGGDFGAEEEPQFGEGFGIDTSPVPEPASLILFALGAAGLIRKSRTGPNRRMGGASLSGHARRNA